MTDDLPSISSDVLTPAQLQDWLAQETRDSAKAHELRTKEATEFVSAYADGKLSPEEAMERFRSYDRRWGEALFGTSAFAGMNDADILAAIDEARNAMYNSRAVRRQRKTQTDRGI